MILISHKSLETRLICFYRFKSFYPGRDNLSRSCLLAINASQFCKPLSPLNFFPLSFSRIEGRSTLPGTQSPQRSASISSALVRFIPQSDNRLPSSGPLYFSRSSASASTSPCRHLATSELSPSGWLIWEDILPRSKAIGAVLRNSKVQYEKRVRPGFSLR
jgi:hypothetical protein